MNNNSKILKVWLMVLIAFSHLHAVGFFSLNTRDFGGSLYNFDLSLTAKPIRWLGISLSYQQFNVRVYFPSDEINSTVEYNFRGPSLGLTFIF